MVGARGAWPRRACVAAFGRATWCARVGRSIYGCASASSLFSCWGLHACGSFALFGWLTCWQQEDQWAGSKQGGFFAGATWLHDLLSASHVHNLDKLCFPRATMSGLIVRRSCPATGLEATGLDGSGFHDPRVVHKYKSLCLTSFVLSLELFFKTRQRTCHFH
jgi:hypothetical protein